MTTKAPCTEKRGNISVLLVDDEEEFLASMVRVLTRRGFSVVTATGGEEALNAVREHAVDVAVLDVKMPGLNGIDVLGRMKRISPNVEVILLTGHASMDSATTGMELGAFDYLSKPHDPEELALKITAAAARKRSNG